MQIRYLGTTGFAVKSNDRTLVFDPYVSRPSLFEFLFKTIQVKTEVIDRVIPDVDDVVIGHSHIDHILDAPYLCQRSGARLIGSISTANVGRAAGLFDNQLVTVAAAGGVVESGPIKLTAIASAHGRMFGKVPLPGLMAEPPKWPPRYKDLLCGEVFDWLVESDDGKKLLYVDSCEFYPEQYEGVTADVICLCVVGRKWRANYIKEIVSMVQPKYIIPSHWDWLFTDYDQPLKAFPGINLPQVIDEIQSYNVEPVVLQLDEVFEF